jgi:hypothetical protein
MARTGRRIALALLLGGVPPAFANGGVPMLFETFPQMLIALLPIVALESFLVARRLGMRFRRTLVPVGAGNALSTFVGIPITWAVLVMVESAVGAQGYSVDTPLQKVAAVIAQAPWLSYYRFDLYWMIPAAALVLLVPFYFVSWGVEYWLVRRMLRTAAPGAVNGAVRNANLASYTVLALVALAQLLVAVAPA